MDRIQILALLTSVALIIFVLGLIKKRRLKEEYAFLWLLIGLVIAVISVFRNLLEVLGDILGIFYSPAALLLLAVLFILLILFHFSVVISGLSEKIRLLAQKTARLEQELEERKPDANKP
ncbi:MAG: DUF2304 domain-containing protein [Candidatus Saganbacteria bacterium]|nr:DUF2304 domain-containing protein [Candidatus Saganbacteria bacterium]